MVTREEYVERMKKLYSDPSFIASSVMTDIDNNVYINNLLVANNNTTLERLAFIKRVLDNNIFFIDGGIGNGVILKYLNDNNIKHMCIELNKELCNMYTDHNVIHGDYFEVIERYVLNTETTTIFNTVSIYNTSDEVSLLVNRISKLTDNFIIINKIFVDEFEDINNRFNILAHYIKDKTCFIAIASTH